jgi:YVTN family beta-propeller protein
MKLICKKLLLVAFLSVFFITLDSINFTGCNSNPVTPTSNIKFSRDVLPIFLQNCAVHGCHEYGTQNNDNLELSSWNSIAVRGFRVGAAIIPYNAFWSNLVSHINLDTNLSLVAKEPRMPKARPPITGEPLPPNIIHTIIQWINEGAKSDDGTVAYNNIPNKAFITNQASDLIAVVNLDNNFVVRLIPVGSRPTMLDVPHHVTVDNQGRYFYPALIVEGTIEKYDAWTYDKLGSLFLGTSPAEIFLMNDGNKGYVTNWDAGVSGFKGVHLVNTQDMSLILSISDARMWATHGGRVTHDDQYFIAISQQSEYITIIRTSDNEIEQQIPIDATVPPNGNGTNQFQPYAVAITPDDRYAFISCPKSNDVRVLDLQSRTIIRTISAPEYPLMLEVSPDGRWCYVPNRNSNTLTIIDIQSMSVVNIVPDIGVQPHGADFTEDGHYAYVTCESQAAGNSYLHHPLTGSNKPGTTAVIDVWAGHVKIKDIEMASFPNGISITSGSGN